MKKCPFCSQLETEVIAENELTKAFFDKFPVNTGHVLIIPKRHFADLFEATREEMKALTELLFEVKRSLQDRYNPDGYNVGVNVGAAAGQTIFHLHIHVIPRYHGDVEDPRGGIRKLKPSIVPYLEEVEGQTTD
jgi:diadenosine tetraphosphate (Ap4A) HIT family hydrolase